jgi:hypothetical protein
MSLLESVANGKFQIESEKVSLRQNPAVGDKYIVGPGSLYIDEDGRINFTIKGSDSNFHMGRWLKGVSTASAGRLYKEEDYFDLEVVSSDGTKWVEPRVLPRWTFEFGGAIEANGKANIIFSLAAPSSAEYRMDIHLLEKIEFPFNEYTVKSVDGSDHSALDKARCEHNGLSIEFGESDFGFYISAQSEVRMPHDLEVRLLEALRFVTGSAYYPRVICVSTPELKEASIRKRVSRGAKARTYPPIQHLHPNYLKDISKLFLAYLDYTISNGPKDEWHPISFHLSNFIDSSTADVHLQAMALGVAIEGVLAFIDVPKDKQQIVAAEQFRSAVLEFAQQTYPSSNLPRRLEGMLGRLTEISPQDKINWLSDLGWIEESQKKTWSNLRNKHVHPSRKFIDPTDAAYLQSLVDSLHKAVTLFHQIIFFIISYEGEFTDYGSYGYPQRETPRRA